MDLLTANDRAGEYPNSHYAHVAGSQEPLSSLSGEHQCDVCVVGGGFTGLSSALHLAERGYDVVLLEAQRVGFGASGRNGGQVGIGQRVDQDALEKQLGKDHARRLWDISVQSVARVRELASHPEVGVRFYDGIIHADHKARFVPETHAYVEKLRRDYDYQEMSALDQDGLRALVNSPAYHGGCLDLGSGHIDPLAFALGLSRLARSNGAKLFENSKVTRIDPGPIVTVHTKQARVKARHVVLACNGYLGGLQPDVAAHVMPINNFIIATEPMNPEQRDALIRNNHAVADSKFVVNYFRFSEDSRLLFGGSESYGYRFPSDIAAKVRKPMLEIYPQLKDTRIERAWGGTLAITMNRMPHFERLAGNILSMSGYSGHGVAMATLAGQIGAEAIAGQAERFDAMSEVPTPRFPGGTALRTPLLVLAMIWYSLRDRL